MNDLSDSIRRFVDGAQDPITVGEVKSMVSNRADLPRHQTGDRVGRRSRWSVLAGFVAAAAALLLLFLPGSSTVNPSSAAAAELRHLATVAATQPDSTLGAKEWLHTDANVVFSVKSPSTSGGALQAVATVSAATQSWANSESTCVQAAFGNLQFSSPAEQKAWVASGLAISPLVNQPVGQCSLNSGALPDPAAGSSGVGDGLGVIDVAGLPSDPSALANVLENGDSGNAVLDQSVNQSNSKNPGFERAVFLLVVPTVNRTSSFDSALLSAVATMPGVSSLGRTASQSGATGVGFASGNGQDDPTVVLDPTTGGLLEARNLSFGSLYWALGQSTFWNPGATGSGTIDPASLHVGILVFDPVGGSQIVDSTPPFGVAF